MTADTWKQFERNPISHSAAHHIIAIAELRESTGYARVSDVAKTLNITRGSASLTIKTLKQRGLILEDDNRFLRLSASGEAVANAVRGKKFLLQNFLHNVLGVSSQTAEEDTCKIEHLISSETADRLAAFLRFVASNDKRTTAFLAAWNLYNEPCDHDPAGCPACNVDCLVSLCQTADRDGGSAR
ncbi:MAG: metal-dependent transcriptional regulator [Planctomycetota bacterium]|jgi:Mn-dependent DtxR family transcriptional regulator